MAITDVKRLSELASTALATYAYFLNENELAFRLTRPDSEQGVGMTESQANKFDSQYNILDIRPNDLTGFAATLFEDTTDGGKKVLALRGTEFTQGWGQIITDGALADALGIGIAGFANFQAVQLYRYVKQLSTDGGQVVQYSDDDIVKIFMLANAAAIESLSIVIPPGSVHDIAQWVLQQSGFSNLHNDLNQDRGIGTGAALLQSGDKIDVTGHSLGGHLALLFARMFPQYTDQVVTLNAPTFFSYGDTFLTSIGFPPGSGNNITRLEADGDFVHKLGNVDPGYAIFIAQEDFGISGAISDNHSSVNGVDGLNLMALFAQLDPSLINSPMQISDLIRKASNDYKNTYEKTLDFLRHFVLGENITDTVVSTGSTDSNRASLYSNMNALINSTTFQAIAGRVTLTSSPTNITEIRDNFGAFLSLYHLSPFAIKANDITADNALKNANLSLKYQWEADADLTSEEIASGEANFSDMWIADRLAMLSWVNKRNNEDASVNKIFDGPDSLFWDEATQTEIQVGSFLVGGVDRRQFKFGDKNDNLIEGGNKNDRLYGMDGNDVIVGGSGDDVLDGGAGQDTLNGGSGRDILYGGADEDSLNGGSGNDRLLGGAGVDAYQFSGSYGIDIVNDSDGQGVVLVNDVALNSASLKLAGVYKNDITGYTFTNVNGGNTLIISKENDPNRIIINNWSATNNLSIDLNNDFPLTPSGNIMNGDFKKMVNPNGTIDPSDDIFFNDGKNYISDGPQANALDMITGTSASDVISGFGGDDFLYGAAGSDYIYGGDGNDLLQGGTGVDYIFGGSGNDVIYAGAGLVPDPVWRYQELTPDVEYYTVIGSGLTWLTLYTDDYVLSNGALYTSRIVYRDALWLGSDGIYSDGANNYIDGGSGNDMVIGSAGAEYVLGGAGKDSIFGFGGDDTILGGEDNDYLVGDDNVLRSLTGNDVLDGGGGNDILVGSAGDDILFGSSGDDYLWGDFSDGTDDVNGNDFLFGGEGDDQLAGGAGDDYLDGGDNDDTLYGGAGNDILIGGVGADKFYGGAGADTIYLNIKEGDQLKEFSDSADTVIYDVKESEVQEVIAEQDLIGNLTGMVSLILNDSQGQRSTIGSYISDADFYHYFSDGEQVLNSDFLGNTLNTQLNYTAAHLAMFGGKLNDTLIAVGDGDSILFGGQGNDFLQGNSGDNLLQGGVGNDIYVYNAGGGVDHIVDSSTEANGLVFGQGITSEQIKLRLGSLLIDLGNGDQIHIDNFDKDDVLNSSSIKTFTFADGVTLSLSDLVSRGFDIDGDAMDNNLEGTSVVDRINGLDGDDIITGGKGSDELLGGEGNDKYILREGDGEDVIVDDAGVNQVVFAEGIDKESLTFEQYRAEDGYLYLGVGYGTQGDYVAIRNGMNNTISSFEFSDGATFTLKELLGTNELPMTITGSESADNLFGGAGADVINALEGNDEVYGGGSSDTINGAEGDDVLYGEDGNDILMGENGKDTLYGGDGNDVLNGGKGNDVLEGGAGVDSYVLDLATGKDIVIEEANLGELNVLKLGDGISISDLAFKQKINDLEVGILGTSDVLVIKDFYSQTQNWQLLDNSGTSHTVVDLISATAISSVSELAEYYTKLTTLSYKSFLADIGYKQDVNGVFKKTDYDDFSDFNESSTTITTTNLELVVKDYISNAAESVYQSPSGEYNKQLTNYTVKTVQQYFASGVSATKPGSNVSAVFIRNTGNGDDAAIAHSSAFDGGYVRVTPTGYWVTNPYGTGGSPTGSISSATRYIYQSEYEVNAKRYLDAFTFGEGDNVFKFSGSTMTTIDLGAGDDVLIANYEYTGEEFDLSNSFDDFYSMSDLQSADFYKGRYFVQNYLGLGQYTLEDQSAWFSLSSNGLIGFDNYFNNYLPSKYNSINGSFINGNDGNDVIFGSYNNDLIVGGDGNDYLDGGAGADHYYFFVGDDGIDRINDSDAISELPTNFESFMNVYEAYFYGFKNRITDPDLKLRYERETLSNMPMLDAMDYAQLSELYDHGVIPTDTIHFGPGITLSGLTLSWANRALKIEWGVNKGVIIDLPVDTDLPEDLSLGGYDYSSGLGRGIEKFVFADGTELSMGEMLTLVGTPMPTVTPLSFGLGMGTVTNEGSWANKIVFAEDITSEDVFFTYINSQLIIEHKNGTDKMVLGGSFPEISTFDPDDFDDNTLHSVFTLTFGEGLELHVNELFLYEAFHTLNSVQPNSSLEINSDMYHAVNSSSGVDNILIKQGSYDGVVVNAAAGDDVIQNSSSTRAFLFGGEGNDTIISGTANDGLFGGIGDDTLTGGDGDDYLEGGDGYDSLQGGNGNDELYGGDGDDYMYGGAGDDYLDGGAGADGMSGGLGNDTFIVDDEGDYLSGETATGGLDTVISSAISYYGMADAAYIETLRLVGDAIEGSGNWGTNLLVGNANNNILGGSDGTRFRESAGNDILQGMEGNDTFNDELDNNLFDGGTGEDIVNAGSGHDLVIGGEGNDTITTGTGYDVIMFNKGDGADIVNASVGTDNTLSLGGDFAYSDLSLTKSSNDLILKMGASDQITFKGWYDTSANNKSILNLQVIAESMQGFSLGGSDTLRDNKVETFNFANLVAAFDAAGTTANWQLTDARLTAHLSAGSDTAAIGGDIAYQYGKAGSLTGVGFLAAQSVLSGSTLGQSAQTINDPSSWAAETIKLS